MLFNALLAAAAAQPTTPLPPNGNWTVAYEESMCLASRKFGASGEVTLALRPSPMGDGLEITFVTAGSGDRRVVWNGKAKLRVQPGDREFDADYKAWRSHALGGRAIILYAKQDVIDAMKDEGSLSFSASNEPALSVSTRHLQKLKPVIEDCKKTVAKHWGVDPIEFEQVATQAEPDVEPSRWVRFTDYPGDALRKGQSGVSSLLWTIGTDGRVTDCKVVASSGVASLDRAGCQAISERARYKPALDKTGKAMVSHGMRRIMWITSAY